MSSLLRYERPLPGDAAERDLIIAWLGVEFFDEDKWMQKRDLAWELDLVSADGVDENGVPVESEKERGGGGGGGGGGGVELS